MNSRHAPAGTSLEGIRTPCVGAFEYVGAYHAQFGAVHHVCRDELHSTPCDIFGASPFLVAAPSAPTEGSSSGQCGDATYQHLHHRALPKPYRPPSLSSRHLLHRPRLLSLLRLPSHICSCSCRYCSCRYCCSCCCCRR